MKTFQMVGLSLVHASLYFKIIIEVLVGCLLSNSFITEIEYEITVKLYCSSFSNSEPFDNNTQSNQVYTYQVD